MIRDKTRKDTLEPFAKLIEGEDDSADIRVYEIKELLQSLKKGEKSTFEEDMKRFKRLEKIKRAKQKQ